MPLPELDPNDIPPAWMVVAMTVVFPGGGQLALGDKKRGGIFVGVTVILMGLFFIFFAQLVSAFWGRMQIGADPMDSYVTDHIVRIGYVLAAGVVEVIVAAVDALATRRRVVAERS